MNTDSAPLICLAVTSSLRAFYVAYQMPLKFCLSFRVSLCVSCLFLLLTQGEYAE
jgi:hypothetical protein